MKSIKFLIALICSLLSMGAFISSSFYLVTMLFLIIKDGWDNNETIWLLLMTSGTIITYLTHISNRSWMIKWIDNWFDYYIHNIYK